MTSKFKIFSHMILGFSRERVKVHPVICHALFYQSQTCAFDSEFIYTLSWTTISMSIKQSTGQKYHLAASSCTLRDHHQFYKSYMPMIWGTYNKYHTTTFLTRKCFIGDQPMLPWGMDNSPIFRTIYDNFRKIIPHRHNSHITVIWSKKVAVNAKQSMYLLTKAPSIIPWL